MTYEFVFTKRAVKDLDKLNEKTKKQIIDQLKVFRKDPIPPARKLMNPKLGIYRYKVDDY